MAIIIIRRRRNFNYYYQLNSWTHVGVVHRISDKVDEFWDARGRGMLCSIYLPRSAGWFVEFLFYYFNYYNINCWVFIYNNNSRHHHLQVIVIIHVDSLTHPKFWCLQRNSSWCDSRRQRLHVSVAMLASMSHSDNLSFCLIMFLSVGIFAKVFTN